MKIETLFLSDKEVLAGVRIFVEETDFGGYKMINTNSVDVETFFRDHNIYTSDEELDYIKEFMASHEGWEVWILTVMGEACGLIAFDDWC